MDHLWRIFLDELSFRIGRHPEHCSNMYALPIELIYIGYSILASFPNAAKFKKVKTPGLLKKNNPLVNHLWHVLLAEQPSCNSRGGVVHFARMHLIFHLNIWFVWMAPAACALLVLAWWVPHSNGISILITNWSVCTGISYWREPSSCNLHEGTLVIFYSGGVQ